MNDHGKESTAWPLRILVGALAWASVSTAQAQLKNCANMQLESRDYKVVLDDFAYASQTAKDNQKLAELRGRLQFNLNGQIDSIRTSARRLNNRLDVPLKLVFCSGRQPSLNGDEFTDTLAERLSDGRVLVEMWGTLDVRTSAGKPPVPLAWVGYVIPSVQHYASETDPRHVMEYPKRGSPQSIEELESFPELAAFALVGLGTKASRARQYDLAVWAFSRAELGLKDAQLAGGDDFIETLLAYVRHTACTTRVSARNDRNYTGPLSLVPAQACTGAP